MAGTQNIIHTVNCRLPDQLIKGVTRQTDSGSLQLCTDLTQLDKWNAEVAGKGDG